MVPANTWKNLPALRGAALLLVFCTAPVAAGDAPTAYRTPTLAELAYKTTQSSHTGQPGPAVQEPAPAVKQPKTPGQLTAQQRPAPAGAGQPAPKEETLPVPKDAPPGLASPEYVTQAPKIEYHEEGKGPKEIVCDAAKLVWQDYKNYYSWQNLALVGGGVLVAAPIANSSADHNIQQWYQEQVRTQSTDDFAKVVKQFGEFQYAIPVYLAATAVGKLTEDYAAGSAVFNWGQRSLRALLVGAPPVGILQVGLGSGRPHYTSSKWRPLFASNAVSGHAFVGSIPFLTAAAMIDNKPTKLALGAASMLTAWSRLNDNDHYFSQAALGWWMGYLAVRTVDQTEDERNVSLLPVTPTGDPGFGVMVQY